MVLGGQIVATENLYYLIELVLIVLTPSTTQKRGSVNVDIPNCAIPTTHQDLILLNLAEYVQSEINKFFLLMF